MENGSGMGEVLSGDTPSGAIYLDYEPGHFLAEFKQSDYFDYIDLHVRLGGDVRRVTDAAADGRRIEPGEVLRSPSVAFTFEISSAWCPFRDLIAFLEAITLDVQECAFDWDAEGPGGRMEWLRSSRGQGMLKLQWHSSRDPFGVDTLVSKGEFVGRLYTAFRNFATSADYNPRRYESASNAEALEQVLEDASVDQVIAEVCRLPHARAEPAVRAIASAIWVGAERTPTPKISLAQILAGKAEPEHTHLTSYWDLDLMETREAELRALLACQANPSWFGCKLRPLRSKIIEDWLFLGTSCG